MVTTIFDTKGSKKGTISLARLVSLPVRVDIIKRAVVVENSKIRQPYGADPLAGKRTSAHYHGRRSVRFTMMNREMARMKRIHNSGSLSFVARFVPQSKKGRRAHPPKVEKDFKLEMNQKERFIALMSAISAGMNKDMVLARGHKISNEVPLVFTDDLEKINKSKEIVELFKKVGLENEMERLKKKKIRAGKGTTRGRKYTRKKGPLVIIKEDRGITRAVRNIPGMQAVPMEDLSVSMVAPGGMPGRMLIFTESAAKAMEGMESTKKETKSKS